MAMMLHTTDLAAVRGRIGLNAWEMHIKLQTPDDSYVKGLNHSSSRQEGLQADLEVARQPVCELLCIQRYLGIQVDGGGVLQQLALALHRINYPGVTVPHADCDNARKCLQSI